MNDQYYDNDVSQDNLLYGAPVPVEFQFPHRLDYEAFILSLPTDQAKVLVVRALGLNGKEAAAAAGFSSEWVYWRAGQRLNKSLKRKQEEYFG